MTARILSTDEVANTLRIPPAMVLSMVAKGELAALVVCRGEVLVCEAALREFIGSSWATWPYPLDGGGDQ